MYEALKKMPAIGDVVETRGKEGIVVCTLFIQTNYSGDNPWVWAAPKRYLDESLVAIEQQEISGSTDCRDKMYKRLQARYGFILFYDFKCETLRKTGEHDFGISEEHKVALRDSCALANVFESDGRYFSIDGAFVATRGDTPVVHLTLFSRRGAFANGSLYQVQPLAAMLPAISSGRVRRVQRLNAA
jgi:hypothetical protein